MTPQRLFDSRHAYSRSRLALLSKRVSHVSSLRRFSGLGIYVTGSYGRLEASEQSDLDLFFVFDDLGKEKKIDKLSKILIDGALIGTTRNMGFPEFSNEGEFLEIHSLKDMLKTLGGREDDYSNRFTARMLLILESRPIYNRSAYNRIVEKIVHAYFRDYHGHEKDFRPIFLVNDILRYWKTLCLNYENKRNLRSSNADTNNKNHLRNLKLKFSRLLTCFSAAIPLCARSSTTREQIVDLIRRPPIERIESVAKESNKNRQFLESILSEYAWFLSVTAKPGVLSWIGEHRNRDVAFGRARIFGKQVFNLLDRSCSDDILRYLVI